MSEEEITKPKSDTIKEIYLSLICLTNQKSREEIIKPTTQELSSLKYSDTGDEIIPILKLFKYLSKLIPRIGCSDDPFKLSDLFNPEFRRTRKYLSAFINYLRFATEEHDLLMDNNAEFVQSRISMEDFKRLKEEKEKYVQEINGLKKIQAEQLPIVTQKMEQIAEIEAEKNKVIEERKKLEDKMQALANEVDNCEKAIEEIDTYISDSEQALKDLEQNVIGDPEKFRRPLIEKNKKFEEFSKVAKNSQLTVEEIKAQTEKMENLIGKVREAAILVETIEKGNNKYKELLKTLEINKQEILKLEQEIYQKNLENNSVDSEHKSAVVMLETIHKSGEGKVSTLESSLETKKAEKDYLIKQNQELQQEVNEKKKALESLEAQIKTMEDRHAASMKELKEEHERTISKTEIYRNRILQTIKNHDFSKNIRSNPKIGKFDLDLE